MAAFASAQELEPGAYWPIPARLNIVTLTNSVNWGDLAFDPAAPIDYPTFADGAWGMKCIEAVMDSGEKLAWVKVG